MKPALFALCALSAGAAFAAPRFIGAQEYGVRPGNELIWRVPVHGATAVEAVKLPEGIAFDAANRTLRGRIAKPGDYAVTLRATDGKATTEERLTIRVGETICLAPPMGWNSWYSYSEAVSQEGMEKVARLLESSGLADAGWSYVNIDDCWQGERVPGGALQANAKFPDMKALCDAIHAHGLKAGLYSSPWKGTYAGFRGGSFDDEEPGALPDEKRLQPGQIYGRYPGVHRAKADRVGKHWAFDKDAKQWAAWGFDYVKVDWNPNDIPTTARIAKDLRASGRDIVLSLSNAAPIKNFPGLDKHAQLWRTTGDIQDTWGSIRNIGRAQLNWLPHRSKGHWNDPDILQVGLIGTPNRPNVTFRPSRLTQAEQRYQMTLWCFLSAPLLISSDLEHLAPETKALLTDPDLIALDQRYAAAPIAVAQQTKDFFVLRKDIAPDTPVHGLFNDSNVPQTITLPDGSKHTVAPHSARLVPEHLPTLTK